MLDEYTPCCSICKIPLTSYHNSCLEEHINSKHKETKELLKRLNELRRENAALRERLLTGWAGREIEKHDEAMKKKLLESEEKMYEGLVKLTDENIKKKKEELEALKIYIETMSTLTKGEVKGPQVIEDRGQSDAIKELEKEIAKCRHSVLTNIMDKYAIKKPSNEPPNMKDVLLKTPDNKAEPEPELCFIVQQIVETIAKCYALELPAEYRLDESSGKSAKANLDFLCDYFGVEKAGEGRSCAFTTKQLVIKLVDENACSEKGKTTSSNNSRISVKKET